MLPARPLRRAGRGLPVVARVDLRTRERVTLGVHRGGGHRVVTRPAGGRAGVGLVGRPPGRRVLRPNGGAVTLLGHPRERSRETTHYRNPLIEPPFRGIYAVTVPPHPGDLGGESSFTSPSEGTA